MMRIFLYSLIASSIIFISCQSQDHSVSPPSLEQKQDQILVAFPQLELGDSTRGVSQSQPDSSHFIDRTYYLEGEKNTFTGSLVNESWNDTLRGKGIFKDGRIRKFISWYPNGKKNSKMIVLADSSDAKYKTTTWYYSGTLKSKYNNYSGKRYFENGNLKSKWDKNKAVDFWKNGNPKAIWPLKKEERVSVFHGKFKAWNPNNTLSTKGTFKDGRKHGKWVYRDSTGTIEKIIYYEDGKADSSINPT